MTILHMDFETFSECDLKDAGVYRYAEHPSTEIIACSYAFDDGLVHLWIPYNNVPDAVIVGVQALRPTVPIETGARCPNEINEHIRDKGEIRAHNAQFERVLTNGVAGTKLGIPHIAIEQTVCTAAKMAASGLPRSLDEACKALGTEKKSEGGRIEMLQLCKPKKPSKADPSTRYTIDNPLHADKFVAMLVYNIDDTPAERGVDNAVPDLIASEREIYNLDQRINQRGVAVDLGAVRDILFVVERYKEFLAAECENLTTDYLGYGLQPTQREKIADWIRGAGIPGRDKKDCWPGLVDMQAETVKALVKREDVPACVKQLLAIYSTYNAKSVSKLQAMLDAVCADGRLRGMFLFLGAGPGRWSSLIVQLQNLMRPVIEDAPFAKECFATQSLDFVRLMFPDTDIMKVAGSLTRACLIAPPGHDLIFSDFSGIEARVNPWFFGAETELEEFRKHDRGETPYDNYMLAYCDAFHVDPAGIDWKSMEGKLARQIGKVMVLFFNYEGGVSAFLTGVDTYGIDLQAMTEAVLPHLPEQARSHGEWMWINHRKEGVTHDQSIACDGLKYLWRQAHPATRDGWKDLKKAAEQACEFRGQAFGIPSGKIWFKVQEYKGRSWLHMRLPSGRDIKYYNPRWIEPKTIVRPKAIDDGYGGKTYVEEEVTIPGEFRYWGINKDNMQWQELSTYGGKLDENADQGYSSDLLRAAMLNAERAGYPVIATVHDEIIVEIAKGRGSLENVNRLMCDQPPHAAGLPLRAEGKRQEYYWK